MIFPDGSWNLDGKVRLVLNQIGRYIIGDCIMIVKRTLRSTCDTHIVSEKFAETVRGGNDIVIREYKNDGKVIKYGVYGKYMAVYGECAGLPYVSELFQNDKWLMTGDFINNVRRVVTVSDFDYHRLKKNCLMCEQRFTNQGRIICDLCNGLVERYLHQRAFAMWSVSVGNLFGLGSDVCGVIMGFLWAGDD